MVLADYRNIEYEMIDVELSTSRNLRLLMDYRLLHNTASIPPFGTVVQKKTWEILKYEFKT